MKRVVIVLLTSLLTVIASFSKTTYPIIQSDSTVKITYQQLKSTNLIFLEHQKFKLENIELKSPVDNYKKLIRGYNLVDSLNVEKITILNKQIDSDNKTINKQTSKINSLHKRCKIYGGITVGSLVTTLLLILLK